jgi:hypothetical protein
MQDVIYQKTAKGQEAVLQRSADLPSDLRMVLLLINGLREVKTLRMLSETLRDGIAPLVFLEDNGYIEQRQMQNVVAIGGGSAPRPINPSAYTPPSQSQYSPPPQQQQYSPPQPQPQQYAQPQPNYAPPSPNYGVPAPMPGLNERVSALSSYITKVLGEDSAMIVDKVGHIRTDAEFSGMVTRLYDIIKEYRGVKEAERFASAFGR